LHTTPDKKKLTRIEQLKESGAKDSDIQMPQLTLVGLVKLLLESISPALQSGMGLTPLSWQEIKSFVDANEMPLNAFELRVIKNASKAYVNQSQLATNPKCPPPHRIIKRDPMKLAEHIKSVFS
jgi:hypothetical protein